MAMILNDPVTAAMVAAGGLKSIGTLASAQQKAAQQEARAEFAEVKAAKEEVAQQREQRAIERESRRAMAQTRAALASQGASARGAQSLNLTGDTAAQFARKSERSRQDSVLRQRSLRSKASNLQDAASATRVSGFISAAGQMGSSAASAFGGGGSPSKSPSTGGGAAGSGSGTNAPGGPGGEGSIF